MIAAFNASGGGMNKDFAPKFQANQVKMLLEQQLADEQAERDRIALLEESGETSKLAALAGMAEGDFAMGGDPTHKLVQVLKDVDEGGVATSQVSSWELQPISVTVINVPDSKSTVAPMSNMAQQTWDNDYWANRGEGGI